MAISHFSSKTITITCVIFDLVCIWTLVENIVAKGGGFLQIFHSHESYLIRVFTCFFGWLFVLVFSLGYVYLCSLLPCIFNGWVPILDFYLQSFPSQIDDRMYVVSKTKGKITKITHQVTRGKENHQGDPTY
jgi:hypothetical protein